MNVNERIARALGWENLNETYPDEAPWPYPWHVDGRPNQKLPDFEHSLDACLPVLADKGWDWVAGTHVEPDGTRRYFANLQRIDRVADSPAAALAECIAQALG